MDRHNKIQFLNLNSIAYNPKSNGYCYNLDDIVSYYRPYMDIMEFWGKSFGSRIYNLDYEQLTINQGNENSLTTLA